MRASPGVLALISDDGLAYPVAAAAQCGGALSVHDTGAVGDGQSHPLRERYHDLDAARAEFPHVVSLDDELDWAATQAAINRVAGSGGGQVISPPGIYICNRTLTFPGSREFGSPGVQVSWLGAGALATTYRWPADLGPDTFAVHCPRRYDVDGMYEGLWQDIGLEGPGTPHDAALPLGAAPAQMSGWGWGARRRMTRCLARGFRVGLDIVGDHSRFEDVVCRENLYDVYFARPSQYLYGDLLFEKCMFSCCTLSAIAVHPAARMGGCTMISCYIGGGPYGILKEAGDGDDVVVGQSFFLNCSFEYIGNAWLQDDNVPRRAALRSVTFDTCYFQWQEENRLTTGGRRRRAIWDFFRAEDVKWVQFKEPFALTPGDEAMLCVQASRGCEIVGQVSHLIRNAHEGKRPLLHASAAQYQGHRSWRLEEPAEWGARFMQVTDQSAPVQQGDVLELTSNGQVQRATAGPNPTAGICLFDAGPGDLTIVAITAAAVMVRCGDGVVSGPVAKGADGLAVVAAGDRSSFGWVVEAQQGRALVLLRGLI